MAGDYTGATISLSKEYKLLYVSFTIVITGTPSCSYTMGFKDSLASNYGHNNYTSYIHEGGTYSNSWVYTLDKVNNKAIYVVSNINSIEFDTNNKSYPYKINISSDAGSSPWSATFKSTITVYGVNF